MGMKKNIWLYAVLLLLWNFPQLSLAQQSVIRGSVTDEKSAEPLPFVNIGVKGQSAGTFSDSNGTYHLDLPRGEYDLILSSVGYEKLEQHIHVDGKRVYHIDFRLISTSQELSTVVVSASKYAQKLEESIATIEVIKAQSIRNSNPTSIDKAIEKIPGITIVDNEPQIRGGSGFSSGLGSRVMVMVDEIPVLRGDAGRPNWGFLPVDDVEQIELIKGASSVIYGSSAITGALNIRTAYPKDVPETRVNSFIGVYSKPSRKYTTPWSGMNPIQYGFSVTHLHKYEHIDVGVGASYYHDQGFVKGTPEVASDTTFNKGEFERRGKVYFNTRIRNRKISGLTYGINGNMMYSDNAQAFFWYDADTNIYRSFPGALSHFREFTFYVDPYIKYFNKNGNSHSLKNRVYYGNTDANNNQSNRYLTVYNEYQHTHKFKKLGDLMLVTGVMNTYSHSYGQVFSGKLAENGTPTLNDFGEYSSDNLAVYAQVEKKFFKRLTLLLGGRWEYYQIAGLKESKPIYRAGLNLQATRGTFVRASFGQGYRAPSIGERYITTTSGTAGFYPNPDLRSETSLSGELGVKQLFKAGKFGAMVDISGFYERYDNYVEFNFGTWGNTMLTESTGFKFLNTGPARIYGADVTLAGNGKILSNLTLSVLMGYTWSVPEAMEPYKYYYEHFEQSTHKMGYYSFRNTSSDTTTNILKYRYEHIAKSDIQLTYRNRFSTGFSVVYYSFMKNIDVSLIHLDEPQAMHSGIEKYRMEHNKGTVVVDFRLSYLLGDFKFSLLVNNLLNTEYSLRPITIESPRITSLQVLLTI